MDKNQTQSKIYDKSDIENMLRSYLLKKSQLQELESKIEKNKILIKYIDKTYQQSKEEAIEEMALKAPTISQTPKSKTNNKSNPTEEITLKILKYDKNVTYSSSQANKEKLMNENGTYLQNEKEIIEIIDKVERMLSALNNEQKLVIESYYMYEPKWDYVVKNYLAVYNETKSIRRLQKIRDEALDIMIKVINV